MQSWPMLTDMNAISHASSRPLRAALNLVAAISVLVLLGGCQTQPTKTVSSRPVETTPPPLPFKPTITPPDNLSKEILLNYLAGEIALQRSNWEQAYQHLFSAADEAKDPVAASQAARIAWKQKNMDRAAKAIELWIKLAPNDLSARHMAVLVALAKNDITAAESQARDSLKIAKALGKDGFLLLASTLNNHGGPLKLELMSRIANSHADNAHAQYALALVATQLKKYSFADKALSKTLELDEQWDKPYLLRIQIYALQHNQHAVEQTLQKAISHNPSPILLEAYARLLIQQKKYAEALAMLQQAQKTQPDNDDLTYSIGILALQMEDWDLARQSWNRLLQNANSEKHQEALYFLGQTEELQGNRKQAINFYKKVSRQPLEKDARLRIAVLQMQSGDSKSAHATFNALRLSYPDQATQYYIAEAQALKQAGHPQQALNIYTEALLAYPDNTDLRYAHGMLAADLGQLAAAEADFKWILSRKPDDADTLNAWGYTLTNQTNRHQEALGYIAKALQLKPDSPAILDSMGWVLHKMGKHQEALKYLRKAAAALDDGEILAHLAETLWATGAHAEATTVLQHALTRHPNNKALKDAAEHLR